MITLIWLQTDQIKFFQIKIFGNFSKTNKQQKKIKEELSPLHIYIICMQILSNAYALKVLLTDWGGSGNSPLERQPQMDVCLVFGVWCSLFVVWCLAFGVLSVATRTGSVPLYPLASASALAIQPSVDIDLRTSTRTGCVILQEKDKPSSSSRHSVNVTDTRWLVLWISTKFIHSIIQFIYTPPHCYI